MSAPATTSSTRSDGTLRKTSATQNIERFTDISVTTARVELITTESLSANSLNGNNGMFLPVPVTSSENLDTIVGDDNGMMETRLFVTTTDENLIGVESQSDAISTIKYDNGTIKIHESPPTSQMPSTIKSDLSPAAPTIESNGNNKSDSINSDVTASRKAMNVDVTLVTTAPPLRAPSVATTIEMPIKLDADNLKIMANEHDFPAEPVAVDDGEGKKRKLKDSKKKALKAQWGMDKKQKLKQKLFSDVNHSTIVPTNEPTTQSYADKATELYETTQAATVSTSIKTAPTTIKSTTLTTIKTFQSTQPLSYERITTESALNANEMELAPTIEASAAATIEQPTRHSDNVIVLNTNSSGLIVVDIMENFGTENAFNNTETFEIKMDLIDDATTTEASRESPESEMAQILDSVQKLLGKDDIFLTTIETPTSIDNSDGRKSYTTTPNDDIILINENDPTTSEPSKRIKWNQMRNDESNGNIKITFDNVDLPSQHVNVSIENGELVIDSIDISVLNKAEEELKKKKFDVSHDGRKLNKTDSLEIILIEDDSRQDEKEIHRDNLSENDESNLATEKIVNDDMNESNEEFHATTIHFEVPSVARDHLKKIEMGGSEEEDGIKIKTTDKDSDTIFYISNTEVKVIESIPTASPNASHEKKYYPAIYEEDVIVDVPNKKPSSAASDKYEEDIVLSPLTSDFDPKDINYIGEAFLDVEESQNGVGMSESRHIIPLTSDVVIQPVQLRDSSNVGIPIIGELPPQIELEEMVFSDDYDNKQPSSFHVEEFYPNFLSNRLVKNQLEADVPRELIFDSKNGTSTMPNRTHISVNTMINGTNMTAASNSFPNATAFLVDSEENESAGE